MSWIASGVAVASSYMSYKSAGKAADAAKDAASASIDFEKERYADWKETYGDIESNLSSYYGTLTPDYYAAQGLEAFQKESQAQLEQVQTSLAQRGITDSGIAAQTDIAFAQQAAQERSSIRAQAPHTAREEQFRFLQAGLGLSPGTSYSAALQNQSSSLSTQAGKAQTAAGEAISGAVTSVGTALSDYYTKPADIPAEGGGGGGGGAPKSGGIGGAISGAISSVFSDIRLKDNIQRVGMAANGLGLYTWDWTDLDVVGNQPPCGYIAQEVQEKYPEAIGESNGYMTVDYSEIPNG